MTKQISLDAIVFDAETQIRAAVSDQVVSEYAERMAEGVTFPPVVVFHDGSRYYLADGFHRGLAAKRNGTTDISADVKTGTKTDALWYALGANRVNGHRLTPADKKHAILLAVKTWPERSERDLAEQVGCSKTYVHNLKSQVVSSDHVPDRITGKDGKSYPAHRASDTPQKVSSNTPQKVLSDTRQTVSSDAPQKIDKSRAGAQRRLERMREMAIEGYSSRQIAGALNITVQTCRKKLREEDITVPGDKHKHDRLPDSRTIVERTVLSAEILRWSIDLVDFSVLDHGDIREWVPLLRTARRDLGTFIRRLESELTTEPAEQAPESLGAVQRRA